MMYSEFDWSSNVFVGWGPYAYFQVLAAAAAAAAQAEVAENGEGQRPPQENNGEEEDDGFMGLHLVDNPSMRREGDVETGRG